MRMKQGEHIATRLQELFLDGKWIAGTNYKALLSDVDLDSANHRHMDLNTIALLTFHINYYLKGVMEVLDGGELSIRDKYSFDLPPLKTDQDWQALKTNLLSNAEQIIFKVKSMSPEDLEAPFADPKYGTTRRNIEGILEHSYYHFGQMALIKKLIFFQ